MKYSVEYNGTWATVNVPLDCRLPSGFENKGLNRAIASHRDVASREHKLQDRGVRFTVDAGGNISAAFQITAELTHTKDGGQLIAEIADAATGRFELWLAEACYTAENIAVLGKSDETFQFATKPNLAALDLRLSNALEGLLARIRALEEAARGKDEHRPQILAERLSLIESRLGPDQGFLGNSNIERGLYAVSERVGALEKNWELLAERITALEKKSARKSK